MAMKVTAPIAGLMMNVVIREGGEQAQADLMRLALRAHQKRFFLPGLKTMGIDVHKLSPAVICARYHYLSCAIGGIATEYVEESSTKAWVRYWIGTSPMHFGFSSRMEKAAIEGWHAHDGELLHSIGLKNGLRLGVVITKIVAAGDPVLEICFKEYDRELAFDERCRLIPETNSPDSTHYGDAYLEMLRSNVGAEKYPDDRIFKGMRAYWNYYAEDVLRALLELYGTGPACEIIDYTWRMMAILNAEDWKREFDIVDEGAKGVALFMKAMGDIQEDDMEMEEISPKEFLVRKKSSRMFRGQLDRVPPQLFVAMNGFYEAAAECFRFPTTGTKTKIKFLKSMAEGDECFEWLVKEY
jgi:hypothetical protein